MQSVRLSGTLAREGRNSPGSHDRKRWDEGPNGMDGLIVSLILQTTCSRKFNFC